MNEVINKIELPRVPPRNPHPSMNEGGDCGACVIAGILGITVEKAYKLHCSGEYYGGKPIPKISSWNRYSMKRSLECMVDEIGLRKINGEPPAPLEHVVTDIPLFPFEEPHTINGLAFGLSGVIQFSAWADYTRAMLAGGYYGIAQVFNNGFRGNAEDGMFGQTNHWVMIRGWQYVYKRNEDPNNKCMGSYFQEIGIGNSALSSPSEQWICISEFLKCWGGYGAMWARPK